MGCAGMRAPMLPCGSAVGTRSLWPGAAPSGSRSGTPRRGAAERATASGPKLSGPMPKLRGPSARVGGRNGGPISMPVALEALGQLLG